MRAPKTVRDIKLANLREVEAARIAKVEANPKSRQARLELAAVQAEIAEVIS